MKGLRVLELSEALNVDSIDILAVCTILKIKATSRLSILSFEECKKIFEEYTQLAIKKNVFGAPTYIINDQIYWGQDRLDFVERHLISMN